jgi:TPR repeat protein
VGVAAPTASPQANPAALSNNGQLRTLLDRAEARRKIGDILGARQFLVLASQLGSVEALSRLAETYDPRMLAAWGVRGVQPDQEQAAKLYAKAQDLAARERSAHAENRGN